MSILSQLKSARPGLSKAETRIAEAVLADPEAMLNIATADLARLAEVSDPMVSRFCKTLGCQSFPDFKVKLAQALANRNAFIAEDVAPGDDVATCIEKRINANQAALEYIRHKIDPQAVSAAVEVLGTARQIEIFGNGGSAAVARDAQHKLFRLGIPTVAYEDHLMQRMVAAGADAATVIIAISFSGRTKSVIAAARIAKHNGAKLIAITNPDSALGKLADITITSGDELEDTTIYVPMTTRIVTLTIIDILTTGLALSMGEDIDRRLQQIKDSLEGSRV